MFHFYKLEYLQAITVYFIKVVLFTVFVAHFVTTEG